MKYSTLIVTLFFGFTLSISSLSSQIFVDNTTNSEKVIVKMKNGNEFIGDIISQDENVLILTSKNGEFRLNVSQISEIENYSYEGDFLFPASHQTRYFFGPSAVPLEKGKGYYQNVYVAGNFINYGINDNFSIGGGLEFISTIAGQPIYFLTPKVGFQVDDEVYLGGGFILAGMVGEGSVTLGYGVSTFGSPESNISIGLGYGSADSNLGKALMVSGTKRTSNSIALLTENYFFRGDENTYYFGIQGFRILSKDNSFDFGILLSSEFDTDLPAFPYVAYSRAF